MIKIPQEAFSLLLSVDILKMLELTVRLTASHCHISLLISIR